MTATRLCIVAILALGSAPAYAEKPLAFDAASIKPATVPTGVTVSGGSIMASGGAQIPRNTGGPGTNDPGRIHYPLISLKALLGRAWDGYSEIRGPGWLDSEVVQVDATMPPDTTKEQFLDMLRNLVTERFGLQYHIETKGVPGYALVVSRNGPKLKESAAVPDPRDEAAFSEMKRNGSVGPRQTGPDGFNIPPRGMTGTGFAAIAGNRARMMSQRETMEGFAHAVGTLLKAPVTDGTGLKGKYDFTVTYGGGFARDGPYASSLTPTSDGTAPATSVPEAQEPLPDIFSALQAQVGLKLEARKVAVEVMVVDHMEKTPAEN